ncbi:MAG: hypothetical protein JO060_09330, partial [Candidatus Eremiobacteraeota bacterium]|nr:hypothetical protein [Candidatus Eremiobacteraeota bacterium]
MTEFSALSTAAAGMEAQRAVLDVDAHNVAAAETGTEFNRLVPRFIVAPMSTEEDGLPMTTRDLQDSGSARAPFQQLGNFSDIGSSLDGERRLVRFADDSAFGGLPDAASLAEGDEPFVRFAGTTTEAGKGVDAITEMVAVLNAQRAYEADASVFEAGKRLAERT